ncbi:hypothetical protein J6TS2_01400 [Heyndrickxia sporothermodurans]|nr:hypothetical protein J6TS2_01400 [Heyndrickxia sporothermodurans]
MTSRGWELQLDKKEKPISHHNKEIEKVYRKEGTSWQFSQ